MDESRSSQDDRRRWTFCIRHGLVRRRGLGWSPEHGAEAWRDTGVSLEGPAVTDVERAFADMWAATGSALPAQEVPDVPPPLSGGSVTVRVIAGSPRLGSLYRLDQLIAAAASAVADGRLLRRYWQTQG